MELVITLRKEVADQQNAEDLYRRFKERMIDFPIDKITGHCTNHFTEKEPE